PLGLDPALRKSRRGRPMFGSEPAIRDDGVHVVVILRGELDIADAADLGAVLSEAVARNPHVIADLSDLTFIDCASLGVVVRARTRAREAGGDLVLAGARGRGGRGGLGGTWFSPGRVEGCGGSWPCRSWLVCSLSMPAWTRRRGKGQTCAFRNFGAGWGTVRSRRAEPGLLDHGGQAAPRRMKRAGARYLPVEKSRRPVYLQATLRKA